MWADGILIPNLHKALLDRQHNACGVVLSAVFCYRKNLLHPKPYVAYRWRLTKFFTPWLYADLVSLRSPFQLTSPIMRLTKFDSVKKTPESEKFAPLFSSSLFFHGTSSSASVSCHFMTTIIDKPNNIDKDLLNQLIDLVEEGDQVQRHFVERGVETADLIAMFVDNGEIHCTATLKNPLKSYSDSVFQSTKVDKVNTENLQELGYIVTNPKYEGKKLCQSLLTEFFKNIGDKQMFATTRKPSMAHILKKFGFNKLGDTYKINLDLFFYDGKK